jgi:hypothetical protein
MNLIVAVFWALLLFQSTNTAVHFAVWSIFPYLWIHLVKNADHADAPTAQRPVAFAFGELLPQPLCGRLFFNLEVICSRFI